MKIEEHGLAEMIKEVDALTREPSAATVARVDATLAETFAPTQSDVHVHTGALKASGRNSSEVDRTTSTWMLLTRHARAPRVGR